VKYGVFFAEKWALLLFTYVLHKYLALNYRFFGFFSYF